MAEMGEVEQVRALTRDWNDKTPIEQILVRHQVWEISSLPNHEYTASFTDVQELINERERSQKLESFLRGRLESITNTLAEVTEERNELYNERERLREALRQCRLEISALAQLGICAFNPAVVQMIDTALNGEKGGE